MPKIVINTCYGGFSLSRKAAEYMAERGHEGAKKALEPRKKGPFTLSDFYWHIDEAYRTDPLVIEAVQALDREADGPHAVLGIATIPDDVEWEIEEYDGVEWIAEKHRTWSADKDA